MCSILHLGLTHRSCVLYVYRIANRRRGVYLLRWSVWCGNYLRAASILLGNMTRAMYPGSAQSTQPKFCQQVGKTFGVAADARGAINTETANLLAGVSEDDDDDPFAGLEEDEDELEENETVLDDC